MTNISIKLFSLYLIKHYVNKVYDNLETNN